MTGGIVRIETLWFMLPIINIIGKEGDALYMVKMGVGNENMLNHQLCLFSQTIQ